MYKKNCLHTGSIVCAKMVRKCDSMNPTKAYLNILKVHAVEGKTDRVIHKFRSKFEAKSGICETYISFRLWDTIFRQSENILN